jgi:hypothetical protein
MGIFGPSGGGGGSIDRGFQKIDAVDHVVVAIGSSKSGNFVAGIEFHYQSETLARFGGSGTVSDAKLFNLNPDEYIAGISGQCGAFVDSVRIMTRNSVTGMERSSDLFGGQGGPNEYIYFVEQGNSITGLWGRAGAGIDAIGVYTAK